MTGGATLTAARRTEATARAVPVTMRRAGESRTVEVYSTARPLDKGTRKILLGVGANDAALLTFEGDSDAFLVFLDLSTTAALSFARSFDETHPL